MGWQKNTITGEVRYVPDVAGPQPWIGKPADPMLPIQIRKGERDLVIGESAEARAQRDQQMQEEKFAWERAERAKDRDAQTAATTRESEDKAGAFLIRAKGADAQYEATGEGPRSYLGQKVRDWAPNLQNSMPIWLGGNDAGRQVADTAQDEFIAASLRQDSGAAIPEEELERQRRIYFPMPGDDPATLKAKQAARDRAMQGLQVSAGRRLPIASQKFYEGAPTQYPEIGGSEAAAAMERGRAKLQRHIAAKTKGMNPAQRAAYAQRAWDLFNRDPRIRGLRGKGSATARGKSTAQGEFLGFED